MQKFSTLVTVAVAALLLTAYAGTQSVHAQSTGNAVAGKQAFMKYGCYECHGTQGQGNYGAGPAIAPHPMPFANLLSYIRAPRGEMPPFDANVLPETDAQNIYAYLETIPAGMRAADIAVLHAIDSGNAGTEHLSPQVIHGRQVFNDYCLKCHGSAPIGPSLANVKAHLTLDATVTQIKNPAPPMPKLFPAPLSAQDVDDVAAYVQTM